MSLDSILSIADSGLASIRNGLAVVSQNVSNAGIPDWSREVAQQSSATAAGGGFGVRSLPTQREVNAQLQGSVFGQNATVAGLQTRQAALAGIDQTQGQVGSGNDLASLLGGVQDAFSALQTDPANQAQQQAVVAAAGRLAGQLRSLSDAVGQARQTAQDQAAAQVSSLNASLTQIGALSDQIVRLQVTKQSTADLENQRDAAIDQLSGIVPVRQVGQPSGDVLLLTTGGLTLPTHGGQPFALAAATLGPSATYPASPAVPRLTLGGVDITPQIGTTGQLGASLNLRDGTLPAYQGALDEFAHTLATRFDQQGLALFTNGAGVVPGATGPNIQSGYVGFAAQVEVNPAVAAQPGLVRDGTHAVLGSGGGASAFAPNPPGGPAGFSGMIARVLDFALGAQSQPGVAQPAPAGAGLGPAGDQSAGFAPPADLAGFAAGLVGTMAQDSSTAATDLGSAQALQTGLQGRLTSQDGVSIDTEMSLMIQLQNAYGANAKVVGSVQAMWDSLLQMVR